MANNQKVSSKSSKASLVIIFLIIGCVIVSNFIGPVKGWGDKILKSRDVTTAKKTEPKEPKKIEVVKPAPKVPKIVKIEDEKPKEEVKVKSKLQELYDSLFKKYRKKFKDPVIGKEYDVYLKSGTISGKLKYFNDGRIVIQKIGMTVTYQVNVVSKRSYPKLFPKKAAKILALKEMKSILEQQEADAISSESETPEAVVVKKRKASPRIKNKKMVYDPSAAPTSEELKKPLRLFAEWVKVQHRRMGGKIADSIYAKKVGRNTVLYMKTSKLFRKQDYDVRFSVTEGMWQMWGFKCIDYRIISTPNQAHLVLLDGKNRIIGGSTTNDASNIWVKK